MDRPPHRDVFDWPSAAWTAQVQLRRGLRNNVSSQSDLWVKNNVLTPSDPETKESVLTPSDLGLELIDNSALEELTMMVKQAMAEDRDDPVVVFDMGVVVDRYKLWTECFPHIKPFYAVKVCDDPAVIGLLAYLGAGFDCASKAEVELVLGLGVPLSQVIYANTVKAPSHLTYAIKRGISLMTVDNEEELLKIKQLAPHARLVVRIAPPQGPATIEYALGRKFGCSPQRAIELLRVARQLDLNVVGVSFHVGSGCGEAGPYVAGITAARTVFDAAHTEGFHLTLLDIGGGLFGNEGAEDKIKQMCVPIKAALEALFPPSTGVTVISEPGRYFVESAMVLGTCVIGKKRPEGGNIRSGKDLTDPEHQVHFEYYVSEHAFGILNMNLYLSHEYNPSPISRHPLEPTPRPSRLWGPTCDSSDLVQECCPLPELGRGDWLVFRDVGAYTVTVGGTFNGFTRPPVRRVMGRGAWERLVNFGGLTEQRNGLVHQEKDSKDIGEEKEGTVVVGGEVVTNGIR